MLNEDLTKDRSYYQGDRPDVIDQIPTDCTTIIDVGCSSGNFGLELKKRNNAEVWGIEYDKESSEKAEKSLDKVFQGDAHDQIHNIPDNYFDLAVFNDVLEHLVNPYDVLKTTNKKLKSGGRVFASIPHVRYYRLLLHILFDKDFKYTESGILDRTHLRWFTKKSIIRMFEEAGYEIESIKGLNLSKSIRPYLLNILLLGTVSDCKYLQYAVIARKK